VWQPRSRSAVSQVRGFISSQHLPGYRLRKFVQFLTFKTQWLLYVPLALTYYNSAFYPLRISVCSFWFSQQTVTVSLNSISGDIMCFLWGTDWILICYSEAILTLFWVVTLSTPIVHRRFGGTYCLLAVTYLGYSSSVKMEAVYSLELR
jgi:hypothetical protein